MVYQVPPTSERGLHPCEFKEGVPDSGDKCLQRPSSSGGEDRGRALESPSTCEFRRANQLHA